MSNVNAITQKHLPQIKQTSPKNGSSFGDTLKASLEDVNGLINNADSMVGKMATGDIEDVHQVVLALEKANIGLELAVEVRNKLLDSYREFMRMQI